MGNWPYTVFLKIMHTKNPHQQFQCRSKVLVLLVFSFAVTGLSQIKITFTVTNFIFHPAPLNFFITVVENVHLFDPIND